MEVIRIIDMYVRQYVRVLNLLLTYLLFSSISILAKKPSFSINKEFTRSICLLLCDDKHLIAKIILMFKTFLFGKLTTKTFISGLIEMIINTHNSNTVKHKYRTFKERIEGLKYSYIKGLIVSCYFWLLVFECNIFDE